MTTSWLRLYHKVLWNNECRLFQQWPSSLPWSPFPDDVIVLFYPFWLRNLANNYPQRDDFSKNKSGQLVRTAALDSKFGTGNEIIIKRTMQVHRSSVDHSWCRKTTHFKGVALIIKIKRVHSSCSIIVLVLEADPQNCRVLYILYICVYFKNSKSCFFISACYDVACNLLC